MRIHSLLMILPLLPALLFARDSTTLIPPEKYLLDLIITDTVSHTVSYLPRGYGFGIEDRDNRNLILVKQGKFNYLLMDGTNRVYLATKTGSGFRFVRQDRSTHEGANYIMMAFSRKDTLYQYGGYGFWKVRDFFTHFNPGIREWEFLEGGEGKENMYTWNYFDPSLDKFFTIGRITKDPHRSKHQVIEDSVFAYDFRKKNFETLGRITAFDWKTEYTTPLGSSLWNAPFGMGMVRWKEIKLFDFSRNLVYRANATFWDTINLSVQRMHRFDANYHNVIYLGDTLYLLAGDEGQYQVSKLRLTKADFDTSHGIPIYEPVTPAFRPTIPFSMSKGMMFLATGVLLAVASLLSFRAGKKFAFNPVPSTLPEKAGYGAASGALQEKNLLPDTGQPSPVNDIRFFLQHLTAVERELLKELVLNSMQDRKLDTDAMNKILGVSNKDAEIQKARRSNSITRINNTFTQVTRIKGLLIQRERDSFDKRAYLYFVPEGLAKRLADELV